MRRVKNSARLAVQDRAQVEVVRLDHENSRHTGIEQLLSLGIVSDGLDLSVCSTLSDITVRATTVWIDDNGNLLKEGPLTPQALVQWL
jgi:hypothetical protein